MERVTAASVAMSGLTVNSFAPSSKDSSSSAAKKFTPTRSAAVHTKTVASTTMTTTMTTTPSTSSRSTNNKTSPPPPPPRPAEHEMATPLISNCLAKTTKGMPPPLELPQAALPPPSPPAVSSPTATTTTTTTTAAATKSAAPTKRATLTTTTTTTPLSASSWHLQSTASTPPTTLPYHSFYVRSNQPVLTASTTLASPLLLATPTAKAPPQQQQQHATKSKDPQHPSSYNPQEQQDDDDADYEELECVDPIPHHIELLETTDKASTTESSQVHDEASVSSTSTQLASASLKLLRTVWVAEQAGRGSLLSRRRRRRGQQQQQQQVWLWQAPNASSSTSSSAAYSLFWMFFASHRRALTSHTSIPPSLSQRPQPESSFVRGLRNYGQTCFFNATLQALASSSIFAHFVVEALHMPTMTTTTTTTTSHSALVWLMQQAVLYLNGQEDWRNDHNKNNSNSAVSNSSLWAVLAASLGWTVPGLTATTTTSTRTMTTTTTRTLVGSAKPSSGVWDPRHLLECIGVRYRQFQSLHQQQDAQELLTALLDSLEQEMVLVDRTQMISPPPSQTAAPAVPSSPSSSSNRSVPIALGSGGPWNVLAEPVPLTPPDNKNNNSAEEDVFTVVSGARSRQVSRRRQQQEQQQASLAKRTTRRMDSTPTTTTTSSSSAGEDKSGTKTSPAGEEKKQEEFEIRVPRVSSEEDLTNPTTTTVTSMTSIHRRIRLQGGVPSNVVTLRSPMTFLPSHNDDEEADFDALTCSDTSSVGLPLTPTKAPSAVNQTKSQTSSSHPKPLPATAQSWMSSASADASVAGSASSSANDSQSSTASGRTWPRPLPGSVTAVPQSMPLSGWMGSTLQCRTCGHVRPIQNTPFGSLSLVLPSLSRGGGVGLSTHNNKPTTLEACLAEFTRVEVVDEVECPSCTRQTHVQEAEEEVALWRGAVEHAQRQQQSEAERAPLEDEFLRALSQWRDWKALPLDDVNLQDPQSPWRKVLETSSVKLQRHSANKSLFLTRLPPVLCLHIQRRYYDSRTDRLAKSGQHVVFGEYLNVAPFCAYTQAPNPNQSRGGGSSTTDDDASSFVAQWAAGKGKSSSSSSLYALGTTTETGLKGVNLSASAMSTTSSLSMGSASSSASRRRPPKVLYRLTAVVEHRGDAYGGHYVCFRRDLKQTGGGWLYISDEVVQSVGWETVQDCEAYMLFYETCTETSSTSSARTL